MLSILIIFSVLVLGIIVLVFLQINKKQHQLIQIKTEKDLLQTERDRFQSENEINKQKEMELTQLSSSLKAKNEGLQTERDKLQSENEISKQKEMELTQRSSSLEAKNEGLQTELENQKTHYEEKIQEREKHFKQLEEKTKVEIQNRTQKILQSTEEHFQKEAEKSLNILLNPFKEKIVAFEQTVQNCYEKESKERFSLTEEIKKIAKTNQSLTQALKGDIKVQGDWGEVVLKRILESSGLQEGREFTTQGKGFGLKNEEGKLLKPDVIVKLPDNHHIVIDSKVSLTHYHNYTASESEEERSQCVKHIVSSLSQHIDNLEKKSYPRAKGLNTPDFVLMFIPLEGVLSLAIQAEKKLFEQAWSQSIAIVSPITLFATLKTIHSLWKVNDQNKNAKEIAKQSGLLYDKFVGFANDMNEIGKGIQNAQDHYDKAFNKLQTGRGNIISKVEKIKKLGADTNKNLPKNFIIEEENIPQIKGSV